MFTVGIWSSWPDAILGLNSYFFLWLDVLWSVVETVVVARCSVRHILNSMKKKCNIVSCSCFTRFTWMCRGWQGLIHDFYTFAFLHIYGLFTISWFFVSSVLGAPWLLSDEGRACFAVFWWFRGHFIFVSSVLSMIVILCLIRDNYVILAFCSNFNLIARCLPTKCSVASFSYHGVS